MKNHKRSVLLAVVSSMFLVTIGCGSTGRPDGISAVGGFELNRYLGTWYEIARLDHKFERGLDAVSATYSLNEDGSVRVVNRGVSSSTGEEDIAIGKAKFVGAQNQAHLKVSFFGPFYGSYIVFELDQENYQHAIVAGPNRKYLWILSRSAQIEADELESLYEIARDNGYDTEKLIRVKH